MAEFVADIGNSGIKLCAMGPVSKPEMARFDNAPGAVRWLKARKASLVLVGSVNSPLERSLTCILRKHGILFRRAGRINLGGLVSHYNMRQLGLDRLANVVAARKRYTAKNLIVLDSGTALTVNVPFDWSVGSLSAASDTRTRQPVKSALGTGQV